MNSPLSDRCWPRLIPYRFENARRVADSHPAFVLFLNSYTPSHLMNYEFRFLHSLESPVDSKNTQLGHYLLATRAKICQAMGPEFEPYLMASLLATAGTKADSSLCGALPFFLEHTALFYSQHDLQTKTLFGKDRESERVGKNPAGWADIWRAHG